MFGKLNWEGKMSIVAGTWMTKVNMMKNVKLSYPCASYPRFGFRFLAYVCGKECYEKISAGRDVDSSILSKNAFDFNQQFEKSKNVLIKNSTLYKNWKSMLLKCCPDVYFSADELDQIFADSEYYNSRLGIMAGEIHTVNFIYEKLLEIKSDISFDTIGSKLIFQGRSQKNVSTDKWIPDLQLLPDGNIMEVEPLNQERFIQALKELSLVD